jgi:hypothetical protein
MVGVELTILIMKRSELFELLKLLRRREDGCGDEESMKRLGMKDLYVVVRLAKKIL